MESKELPTVNEAFENYLIKSGYEIWQMDSNDMKRFAHEYAILFAKWHVKEALKSAYKNAKIDELDDNEYYPIINESSIENAYPESEIK